MESKNLYDKIYKAVMSIPSGQVATYGQIAVMTGNRGYARVVGNQCQQLKKSCGIYPV